MQSVVIPVIQTWGTKQHIRYAVTDTAGRFWTGSGWSDRQRDARLFATHQNATDAARPILLPHFRRGPVYQQFVAPLELQVFTPAEVAPDDLKRFAKKLVKLSALYAGHGTGPIPDSLVLPGCTGAA